MKLLLFHVNEFWWQTTDKTQSGETQNALIVFLQSEREDEARQVTVLKKAADTIKWLSNKTQTTNIVLHPFAHLSGSKSSIEFAQVMLTDLQNKLITKGLSVSTTVFGVFHEFKIHVREESTAKVFIEI